MTEAAEKVVGARREVRGERPRRPRHAARSSRAWASTAPSTRMGCRDYGTNVVGGVTPGQGRHHGRGLPALRHRRSRRCARPGANASRHLRPARRARPTRSWRRPTPASPLVVCITEGIPTLDMVKVWALPARAARPASSGPTAPGIISPGEKCKIGIMPGHIHMGGPVGRRQPQRHAHLRGRRAAHRARHRPDRPASASAATRSSAPTTRTRCALFNEDPATEAIVMIGEIGGSAEEEAADVREGAREEAGGRLHRRADGAAGAPHGPRRRHHRRRQGHRRREDEGHGGGGDPRRQVAGRHRRRPSRTC